MENNQFFASFLKKKEKREKRKEFSFENPGIFFIKLDAKFVFEILSECRISVNILLDIFKVGGKATLIQGWSLLNFRKKSNFLEWLVAWKISLIDQCWYLAFAVVGI